MRLILALVVLLSTSAFACDDAKVTTKRVDSLGNYTIKDDKGGVTQCRVDSLGNTRCVKK